MHAIPPYAILSHTWGDDEVSLQAMQGLKAKYMTKKSRSLKKVIDAARLAASHGYRWIWIDTCCIDKNSSAELSEAINSFYRWYENAGVCYVYLDDYPEGQHDASSDFAEHPDTWTLQNTRWVTRGWTLQELVAPKMVRFYTKYRQPMGEKRDPSVCQALTRATGIEIGVLSGQITVAEISVANRMKWASKRLTKRPEDVAYCLMGLFGVNMPPLYGEGGARAFIRLQEQILKINDDQSIFAWQRHSKDEDKSMHGLLASSPAYFQNTRSIYLMPTGFQSTSSVPWSMTNKGLHVQLYIRPELDTGEEEYLAILDCFQDKKEPDENPNDEFQAYSPAIHLRRLWGDQYTRVRAHVCESLGERARHGGRHETFFVKQNPAPALPNLGIHDYPRFGKTAHNWKLRQVFPRDQWSGDDGVFRLSLYRARGIQGMFRFTRNQHNQRPFAHLDLEYDSLDVAVVLHRTARADLEAVCFPRPQEGSTLEQAYYRLNRIWTKASREEQDYLFGEYQERIMVVPEMIKAVRAGRGLYLINLRERFELETDLSNVPGLWATFHYNLRVALEFQQSMSELDGKPLEEESLKRARAAAPLEDLGPSPPRVEVVEEELKSLLQPLHSWSYSKRDAFRQRLQDGAHNIANIVAAVEICQAIIDGNVPALQSSLKRVDVSDITGPVSTFEGLHLIHLASLTTDPQVISSLLEKGLDPLAVTDQGLNAFQLASICGKSRVVSPILKLRPEAGEMLSITTVPEEPHEAYEKAVSKFRPHFGSEAQHQDTALHLAAVYCTAEEFDTILEEILKATQIPISRWTSSEIAQEREYLVCLRNSFGETVLQRAAAAANREVVRLICGSTPDASTRLDSMGRSALWYAAYGGDHEILELIAAACSRSTGAPILHLSDENGVTPLHVACWRGHGDGVKELLNLGATSLSRTRELDLTPLHYAALFGHDDCLSIMADGVWRGTRQLGDFNAVMDMRASKGSLELFAPIHLAAANGWLECVRVLAVNGASTSTKSSFYYRPSDGNTEDGLERPSQGLVEVVPSTPAEIASREGHEAVCRFLENFEPPGVENRAETTIMDSKSLLEDWNRHIFSSTQQIRED
ncbi:hypothetical protein SLS64_009929 [Diaporthe eres]